MQEKEIWKPIIYKGVDYTGIYEISDMGRVRSLDRIIPFRHYFKPCKGVVLSASLVGPEGKQYLAVNICNLGTTKRIKIHSLVGHVFKRALKKGEVYDHENSNKLDNRANNINILTNRKNSSKERTIKSGLPIGVSEVLDCKNPYASRILINGLLIYLGTYKLIDSAAKAYQIALRSLELNHYANKILIQHIVSKYRISLGLKPIKAHK